MRPLLVTAGATRNPVDAIRYLSAHATGRTGVEVARRLQDVCSVHLLGSAEACLRAPAGLPIEEYTSTRDLMSRMERWCRAHPDGMLVHSAAVGDYEAEVVDGKIPSGQGEIVIRLHPGPKIVDHVRLWAPQLVLVSFKAGRPGLSEEELTQIARAQLRRTRSDRVFANVIGALGESCVWVSETEAEPFAQRGAAVDRLVAYLREQAA